MVITAAEVITTAEIIRLRDLFTMIPIIASIRIKLFEARGDMFQHVLISVLVIGALAFLLDANNAAAAPCKEDALAGVRGETLIMTSGDVYRIGSSPMAVALWMPPTRVTVCERISMSGVAYYAISNKDTNQTVAAALIVD